MTGESFGERPPVPPANWRERPFESWRGFKAVAASRGEVSGPRVEAATVAMSYHRLRRYLIDDMNVAPERADGLIDAMLCDAVGDAGEAVPAEAVMS